MANDVCRNRKQPNALIRVYYWATKPCRCDEDSLLVVYAQRQTASQSAPPSKSSKVHQALKQIESGPSVGQESLPPCKHKQREKAKGRGQTNEGGCMEKYGSVGGIT